MVIILISSKRENIVDERIHIGNVDLAVAIQVTRALVPIAQYHINQVVDVGDIDFSIAVQILCLPLQGRDHNRFSII